MKATFLIAAILVLAGCGTMQEKKTLAGIAGAPPVQCATAKGDLRALESEKAHVGREIGAGVQAIIPISAVIGIVTGTEGTDFKVATGEYNKMIDGRISQIKAACKL